ncbi:MULTISPECIES: M48 family metallopeptidase [Emticicia]|uniref:tetratricopeptide repeat protein n=1 Tax=Emticicia TaxID=312278 RepID=UPI0007D8B687|nr:MULTISPECIES: hypothetical protein [Emticicia]
MQKLIFWRNWPKNEQISFSIILSILAVCILYLSFTWFRGLENVIHWDILSELDEIPAAIDTFSDGKLRFVVNGNAYIVKERFLASTMDVNYWANYAMAFGLGLGLALLLTAFSTMSRYWFLGGMVALAGMLITIHLEIIFQATNQWPFLVAFALLAGLSFYFNNYAPSTNALRRFGSFSALIVLVAIGIGITSKVQQPALAIVSYGLLSAIVFSVIFILFISHEIIAALVWVVSNAGVKNRNHLPSFLTISSIYLLNVLLIYLEKSQYIDWNIISISPLVLYGISMLLAIWGFREYTEQANWFNFRTITAWLYLGLAIITTLMLTFAYATANDPLIEAFEDFISYAHLSMGICFVFYILINFIQPLQKGLEVHKVIYKPKFYELMLFRLAAAIGVFMLISFKNYNNFFQAKAGYYNAIADYYLATDDLQAAETFYKEALHFDIRNHKSNYALASLAQKNNDKENTGVFLKNALEKNASAFAYVGLSKVLQEKDMFFDALFTLREGVSKFPTNEAILTNLAQLYEKTKVIDSTFYYLNLAKEHCENCELTESNLLAYQLKYKANTTEDLKVLKFENNTTTYTSLRANRAAFDKLSKRVAATNLNLTKDSLLNVSQFALLYNLSTFNNYQFSYSTKELQNIQKKELNNSYFEDLEFAISCRNYYAENKLEGIKQLAVLANDSTKHKPLYNQVVGMWFLQQGIYDKALSYLNRASDISSVQLLQQQDYQKTLAEFQEDQGNELVNSLKQNTQATKEHYDKVLAQMPLNSIVLRNYIEFYNEKLKKPNEAYQAIFRAVEVNDNSVELWKLYTLQSLKIGMKDYAGDGLSKVQQLSPPTDYQAFLSIYQAQKALMEKTNDDFK